MHTIELQLVGLISPEYPIHFRLAIHSQLQFICTWSGPYNQSVYHMMPNFLNHRDMYLKMFLTSDIIFNTHNTRSRTMNGKKIAFNQILSEKKKSVSLPLLHHWRWFPRMIVLLIFLYWQTEFASFILT